MTWVPRSASTHATRRAGPGPRDDKKGELCSAGGGAGGCAFFVGKEIKGKCAKIFL